MIIDSHVHIGRTEKTARSWSLESYAAYMDEHRISKAIVMPNVSSVTKASTLNHVLLNEYRAMSPRDSVRFLIFLLIDPADTEEILMPDIAYGFKFHPSITQTCIDDTRLDKYICAARDKDWPILVHCGRDPISHISHLIAANKKFPEVKFIAAHMGGGSTELIEEAIGLLRKATRRAGNIYLDTSNGKLPWLIEQAISKLGNHRIIFGSDEPYADLRVAKHIINLVDVKTETKEVIFHGNIQGLIKPC